MKYKRILLKLSGEALMGTRQYGIDPERLAEYAQDIKAITDKGVEVAIVIGGGNIFRGVSAASKGMDRVQGDHMGMLATVINGLALQSALENAGIAASGVYCGYFGPGQGVMVIAVLARDARRDPAVLNTAKNLIVGCTSVVSNIIYVFSGLVNWPFALALLAGSTVGGTLGGRWATIMHPNFYKALVLVTGLGASAWLFVKYLF